MKLYVMGWEYEVKDNVIRTQWGVRLGEIVEREDPNAPGGKLIASKLDDCTDYAACVAVTHPTAVYTVARIAILKHLNRSLRR